MIVYDGSLKSNNKISASNSLQQNNQKDILHQNQMYDTSQSIEYFNTKSNQVNVGLHQNPIYDSDQSSTDSNTDRLCVNQIYGKI